MNRILSIAKETFDTEINGLIKISENLDRNFVDSVRAIRETQGKLVVTGMGKSGIIGKKISATMSSTGTPSFFMHPAEAFHGDLGMVEKKDIILAISNSGETDEILKIIPFFKDNNNKVISITGNPNSTLAVNSDFHLNINVDKEACPLQLAPTTSTTVTLVIGDALAVSLMELSKFNINNFARFHPGGNIGKKLLIRAENIMKKDNLPLINPDSSILDVIENISKGRLGIAVVCEEDKILGIITDGDLRRALETFKKRSFDVLAHQIMTINPKCISKNMKLNEIEQCMIKYKINSLLVTDKGEPDKLLGVVQFYDLN